MSIIIYILKGILNLIYAVMKLFPVQDKVTIASRQSNEPTMDISMLICEIKRQSPGTEVVCLCRKLDGGIGRKIGYCFHLLNQMHHIATSKAVVVDSYCIGVSFLKQRKSLRVIQMWHALGALKKFGKSIAGNGGEGRSEGIAKAMNMHGNYTYILASGEKCIEPYMEAFGYDKDHVLVGSLPRVDALKSEEYRSSTLAAINSVYPELVTGKNEKQIVVYAPTFRKDKDITSEIATLGEAFDKDKYTLVIKKHPLMSVPEMDGVLVDNKFSTMEMLVAADYVICDYSAIVYEAALLDKPIVFYGFDLDDYTGSRDFYLDYVKDMPGAIGRTGAEVAGFIEADDFDMAAVAKFAADYVKYQWGCTERLARLVLNG